MIELLPHIARWAPFLYILCYKVKVENSTSLHVERHLPNLKILSLVCSRCKSSVALLIPPFGREDESVERSHYQNNPEQVFRPGLLGMSTRRRTLVT
jgi:hypothetical protein